MIDWLFGTGFTKLGLQYYFTAGEKEIRCWTVPRGCLAPQAGKFPLFLPLPKPSQLSTNSNNPQKLGQSTAISNAALSRPKSAPTKISTTCARAGRAWDLSKQRVSIARKGRRMLCKMGISSISNSVSISWFDLFGGFQETNLTFKMLRQRSRFDKRVEIDLTKRDVWWVKCWTRSKEIARAGD